MSNFTFIHDEWPSVFEDAHRAETHLAHDPRAACFYARRTIEGLVDDLYYLYDLPQAYHDDLAAMTNAPAFKALTGPGINQKLNLIRKWGNDAVHDTRSVPQKTALDALRELYHVITWAALHHSTFADQVPVHATFDPRKAGQSAPLSHAEVIALAKKFEAQDKAHAEAIAASTARQRELEEENARLREAIRQAQAQQRVVDDRDYDEAQTRDRFIDVLLREAGWALDQPRDREFEVHGMPNNQGVGYVDYVLWGDDGLPLAVVEAKRTLQTPLAGQEQARLYADCLEARYGRRPVIFYTNGHQHWLWDDQGGYPPRQVQGFYTSDQLEQLIGRRTTRRVLSNEAVNTAVAGRPYQVRAIKAVGRAFDQKERQALLVMATGSGKTRTTIALVEQLMKAGWVKNVLFLADRQELVKQAAEAFTEHLPNSATVNLIKHPQSTGRVYCCTYQTMLRMVNQTDETGRRFNPGAFDLVIVDEAHRSVYGRYGFIFEYFDALLVGLTATPKDEIDHNTYRLFHLEDGVPTDSYELGDAVAEGYLVPPVSVSVGTKFLRGGITYAELSEDEKDAWDELDWGEDGPPDAVGSQEINKFLFNADTIDKVIGHLMSQGYTTDDGQRIAKTIIFAKNQEHADLIAQRFDLGWPQHAGELARVITHKVTYSENLISDFKSPDGKCRIAISVDMLDTGIDVPEVANLVFSKPVYSKTKFWQMLGRGTRLCPDLFGPGRDKQDFFLFDFCGNLEYFSTDPATREGSTQKSLTQRIFETRAQLALELQKQPDLADLRDEVTTALHQFVSGMTLDNVLVRPHRRTVERFAEADAWTSLEASDLEQMEELAGLPSTTAEKQVDAVRFDALVLNRELAQLTGDVTTAEKMRRVLQEIAASLLTQTTIPMVRERAELLERVASDEWWVDVTLPMLESARKRLRDLLQFVPKNRRNPVYTDFADALSEARTVSLPTVASGVDAQRFKQKARAWLLSHEDDLTLQRLQRNKPLTPDDLVALEGMLVEAGGDRADIMWHTEHAGGLGLFVRSLVGLDRAAMQEEFSTFLDDGRYTVDQIRFVNLIIDELARNGQMQPSRLFESPYTDHAPSGPEAVFPPADVDVIVNILDGVRRHALAQGA